MEYCRLSTSFIISQRRPKIPWLKVISSSVTWANLGAILCHEIPVNVLFVFLPRYIRDVMKVSIQSNSLLSVLPIIFFLLSKIGASQLDHVLKKRYPDFCATKLCKIFNSVASLGLGAFLMAASFSGSKQVVLALTCLCLGTASAGLHTPGCLGTLVTMAPGFAGSLSGFAYFFISLTSILNPLLIGAVVRQQSAAEWSLVFQFTSLVAFLPLVFFNLWGSAKEQPWSSLSSSKTVGKEQKNKEGKVVATIATMRSSEKDQSIAEKI
uniref:Uncharacterized protein n=1 Tax=Romanomermis culicivorax TaxID=13658 RepID=A0A915JVP9_ROMCU